MLMDPDNNNDLPPPLTDMFINSTDTLQRRKINQKIPSTWNDHPPLFPVSKPQRRLFGRSQQQQQREQAATKEEDPILLKGVSAIIGFKFTTIIFLVFVHSLSFFRFVSIACE